MANTKKPMEIKDGATEVTRVSSGINCDGVEVVTYFSGGTEIAREILCDDGRQLVMTGTVPDGTVLEYHWVGTLHRVLTYVNNKADGRSRTYYPDGTIWMEQHYKEGALDGPAKTFYKSGAVWEECTYERGKLHGEHKSRYENGDLEAMAHYNQGRLDGDYRAYFRNGMPKETSTFKGGRREGCAVTHHETGGVRSIDMCVTGKVIHRRTFDEEGQLLLEHAEPLAEIEEERIRKAETHLTRGLELATVGCHRQTAEEFRRAISLDPFAFEAYIRLAFAYRRLGSFEDCINTLKALLEINPHHREAYFNLAIVRIVTGNRGEAAAAHRILEDIDERRAKELKAILESSVYGT